MISQMVLNSHGNLKISITHAMESNGKLLNINIHRLICCLIPLIGTFNFKES